MRLFANLFFLLGAAAIAACMSSPLVKWSEDDITVMALYSRDYYNKVSGEDVIYGVLENDTEYTVDESSGFHQLSFPIQETICQKSDKEMADNCMFKEGGVVKFCTAKFHMEDDEDILMVTCQSQDSQQNHTRVRRSRGSGGRGGRGGSSGRGGRGGSGGRGGRGNGRSGAGSSIAGGGRGGGSRYA